MQQRGSISKASMLSERRQAQKATYTIWFYFYDILGKGKVTDTKIRSVHGQELGIGKGQ